MRLFTRYLSRSNVKIIGLSKPGKVLHEVKEIQPDLIILDIMMPKMDGWEVLQSLKLDEETKQFLSSFVLPGENRNLPNLWGQWNF